MTSEVGWEFSYSYLLGLCVDSACPISDLMRGGG